MPILGPNTGTGDPAITDLLTAEEEAERQALRQRLIAARGSTYTYKDPDGVAGRAGGSIDDRGTITLNMGSAFGSTTNLGEGVGEGSAAGTVPNAPITGGTGSGGGVGSGSIGGAGGGGFVGGGGSGSLIDQSNRLPIYPVPGYQSRNINLSGLMNFIPGGRTVTTMAERFKTFMASALKKSD